VRIVEKLDFASKCQCIIFMLTPAEAESSILEAVSLWETEWIAHDSATGRILRRSILADRDLPPYDRVMMDGIAVHWESAGAGLSRVGGDIDLGKPVFAGMPQSRLPGPEAAVEVMTGAVMPEGADTVIPFEMLDIKDGRASLRADSCVERGQFIHRQGSDFGKGYVLVEAGRRLTSRELAVAAGVGKTNLEVSTLPRVGLVSTGDELVDPADAVAPHQIRRSNTHALAAMITAEVLGQPRLVHFPDDQKFLQSGLESLVEEVDVLVLSGGVSRGKKDFIPEVLQGLGVENRFHRVAQRPGKPLWFGVGKDSQLPVFGLPGNPLSTLVCGHRYLLPFLRRCAGLRGHGPDRVSLAEEFLFDPELTLFLPVSIRDGTKGQPLAWPCPVQNSGDYASVVPTDGFVEIPAHLNRIDAGTTLDFFPWS